MGRTLVLILAALGFSVILVIMGFAVGGLR